MTHTSATVNQTSILASVPASTLYLLPYGADRVEEGRRLAFLRLGAAERDLAMAQRGAHPDILELAPPEGKERIGIDQVREVIRQAQFAPVQADRKVCLISRAEALTTEAGNALLKVMEEPPRGLAFVLLADHPSDLLPTIVSRSRLVRVPPPDVQARQAELEGIGYTASEARHILRLTARTADLAPFLETRHDVTQSLDSAAEALRTASIVDLVAACVGEDPVSRREGLLLFLTKAAEGDGETLTVGIRTLAEQERDTIARLLQDLLGLCFELLSSRYSTEEIGSRAAVVRDRMGESRLHDLCRGIEQAHQALVVYGPLEGLLLALLLPEGGEHVD